MTTQDGARIDPDDAELARLGYRRDLRRTLGSFSTFAVIMVPLIALVGAAYYRFAVRGRQRVLAEHSAAAAPSAADVPLGVG
jgi:hypothetical protein